MSTTPSAPAVPAADSARTADQTRDEITTGEIVVPVPRVPAHDTIESGAEVTDPAKTQPEGIVPAEAEPATPAHAHDVDPDEISYASLYTVTAATRPGGLKRGNLAVLIRYWTRGEGRAKIRFGTGGDFNRCLRHLSKYVPPNQVQGFCARLHKIATGQWPGRGRHH